MSNAKCAMRRSRREHDHDRENVRPGKCKESEGVHSPASIPLPHALPCHAVSSLSASPYHASSGPVGDRPRTAAANPVPDGHGAHVLIVILLVLLIPPISH